MHMAEHPYFFIIMASGILGFLAGFIMDRADFCMAGMFRDYFIFRDLFGPRVLLLLMAATMALFEIARLAGILPGYPFPLLGPPSLTNFFGGLVFGVGMVLAGGCVVGVLYKMGRGSLPAMLAFVGLLVGSVLYGEIDRWWSVVAKATQLSDQVTVPQMLGLSPAVPIFVLLAGALFLFLQPRLRTGWVRPTAVAGYLQPWQAALLLATLSLGSYLLVGMPFGVTTAYAKIGAFAENALFPAHLAGLSYFQAQTLTYVPPFGQEMLRGGAGPVFDAIAAVQFPLIAGIIAGAACSALLLREWKMYGRIPWRQAFSALCGGAIMGLASRMAPACNLWHLIGGIPVLAGQSLLFLFGILPGTWLGSRLLMRFVLVRTETR